MSLAAVQQVNEAQKKAEEMLSEKAREARSLTAEAEAAGAALLAGVKSEAAQKNVRLAVEADSEADSETLNIMQKSGKDCDALRASAEGKVPEAAGRIVERIVSG